MERFLKAEGKYVRNNYGKGDVVTLRGTNVGGWQVMEGWMCPTNAVDQRTTIKVFTERFGKEMAEELIKVYENAWWQEADFNHTREMNFNVLRLPFSYLNLLDEAGKLRPDTLATYDWFINECAKRDMYVILDLHAAPGSQNGRDHSGDTNGSRLYSEKLYQDLTVSLWEQLAHHYKGNPTIAGYDLLNEPEGNEEERHPWGGVQFPFYDRLYKAIRAVDPDHMIIFEAIWDPYDMQAPEKYGWENVMYQYHCYGWDGIDDIDKQKSFTDSKVEMMEKANHNVPVLIGEFTLFTQPESWSYALDVYEQNGWSWTTWTYKTVEYGNWGIFNSSKADTPDVDIHTDSIETIREKWGKAATNVGFKKNELLYNILKEKAGKH
jgi:aryl-phospho-beta-D-glucosidase BglC (GH1 family)